MLSALTHNAPERIACDDRLPCVDLWPLTVSDYHALARNGILAKGDPVELIEGCLVRQNATQRIPQPDDLSIWCDVRTRDGVWRLPIWRLTVAQYHEMLRIGILKSGESVELIEGLLVRKMTKGTAHTFACFQLRQAAELVIGKQLHVRIQEPITLDRSEPEPDLAIVLGGPGDYLKSHPGPTSVVLVVEVAEASLTIDRTAKLAVYARNQIAEYWIVNLVDRCFEVYSLPTGPTEPPGFRQRLIYHLGDDVPFHIPNCAAGGVSVSEVIPIE